MAVRSLRDVNSVRRLSTAIITTVAHSTTCDLPAQRPSSERVFDDGYYYAPLSPPSGRRRRDPSGADDGGETSARSARAGNRRRGDAGRFLRKRSSGCRVATLEIKPRMSFQDFATDNGGRKWKKEDTIRSDIKTAINNEPCPVYRLGLVVRI